VLFIQFFLKVKRLNHKPMSSWNGGKHEAPVRRTNCFVSLIPNEFPRRKRRGIYRNILNTPKGGELYPRPPQAD
jgi:hypothetical protein